MKITFFIGSIKGGGAERVVCNLANYLQEKEHYVSIVTMSETDTNYNLSENVHVYPLLTNKKRKGFLYNSIQRIVGLNKYIENNNTDVYVVMLPITTLFLLAFRRKIKVPIIASERNNPTSYKKNIQILLRLLSTRADGWVFQTETARKWYGGRVRNAKVIPNAINPEFLVENIYKGERDQRIVSVGRLNKQKNFNGLIEAYSKSEYLLENYRLVIYGKGPLENELRKKINELHLREKCILAGHVNNIRNEIETASLFVLPSDFEGMPNALMEAMALGIPCVSTDCPCGGPKYLINSGDNGILVPVGDVSRMSEAMECVLKSEDRGQKLGIKAHNISERLNPERIYSEWEMYIQRLSKG